MDTERLRELRDTLKDASVRLAGVRNFILPVEAFNEDKEKRKVLSDIMWLRDNLEATVHRLDAVLPAKEDD